LDPEGRKKTGVITWLLGIPVYEAHFFATEPASTGTLLVITLTKTGVPWLDIAGFMDCVLTHPLQEGIGDANGQISSPQFQSLMMNS